MRTRSNIQSYTTKLEDRSILKSVEDEHIKLAILTTNNHYAVNIFRNKLGLPEAKWEDKGEQQQEEKYPQHDLDVKQRTLSEFLD